MLESESQNFSIFSVVGHLGCLDCFTILSIAWMNVLGPKYFQSECTFLLYSVPSYFVLAFSLLLIYSLIDKPC